MFTKIPTSHATHRTKCTVCGKRRMCHKCVSCEERMCTACSSETKEFYMDWDEEAQLNWKVLLRVCELCLDEAKEFQRHGRSY